MQDEYLFVNKRMYFVELHRKREKQRGRKTEAFH